MITQVNLSLVTRMNVVESTMTSRLKDIVRMNPPIFLVSKVGEDPQEFLDGLYNVLSVMRVTSSEKVYQVSYTQWKDNRPVESRPVEWKEFKEAFLGKYFPHKSMEVRCRSLSISSKVYEC